jgi:hypothetical protein
VIEVEAVHRQLVVSRGSYCSAMLHTHDGAVDYTATQVAHARVVSTAPTLTMRVSTSAATVTIGITIKRSHSLEHSELLSPLSQQAPVLLLPALTVHNHTIL